MTSPNHEIPWIIRVIAGVIITILALVYFGLLYIVECVSRRVRR